ncbi:PREDICTED: protein boule-like, partial [Acanthisitta chloris]|uniref:protein boule-like n=1 Tax=Acanthisitta chloris TaxID=57068 RepID=UPI0004F0EEBB
EATDQMQSESLSPQSNTMSSRTGPVIPNRVFVKGFDSETSEDDLKEFFAQYGSVREVKIVNDRAGVSKGYGFITFETQEDAERILQYIPGSAVTPEAATVQFTSSGYPYVFYNGVAYFHTTVVSPVLPVSNLLVSSPPVMVSAPVYQSPTYHYQGPAQFLPSQSQWPVLQSLTNSLPLGYLQQSEVFHEPVGIPQEGGYVSVPLLMGVAVPE